MLLDIIAFIPKLIIDIFKGIWDIICFIGEFIWEVITIFIPYDSSPNSWASFGGVVLIFLFAFVSREYFGGFFKALGSILITIVGCIVLFALNTVGAIITIVMCLLFAFNVLTPNRYLYMVIGVMWAVMIYMKVMG